MSAGQNCKLSNLIGLKCACTWSSSLQHSLGDFFFAQQNRKKPTGRKKINSKLFTSLGRSVWENNCALGLTGDLGTVFSHTDLLPCT